MGHVTLSFTLTTEEAKKVLDALIAIRGKSQESKSAPPPSPIAKELGFLLHGRTEKLVRFFVENDGEIYNDQLARKLGVGDPTTSAILGKVTQKLRTVGVDAQLWYRKNRMQGRTFLRLRPDVLQLFRESLRGKKRT